MINRNEKCSNFHQGQKKRFSYRFITTIFEYVDMIIHMAIDVKCCFLLLSFSLCSSLVFFFVFISFPSLIKKKSNRIFDRRHNLRRFLVFLFNYIWQVSNWIEKYRELCLVLHNLSSMKTSKCQIERTNRISFWSVDQLEDSFLFSYWCENVKEKFRFGRYCWVKLRRRRKERKKKLFVNVRNFQEKLVF